MPWTRTSAPIPPFRRVFKTEEQLRDFKRHVSRNNMLHASHIAALEKAGCKDWELCNYGALYVLTIAKPLALIRELDKVLGLSLKQLRQLRQSTLKLAERYERLFNAPLVPSDIPILWPGSWLFDESLSLWALPHLLRRAAAKVESWPDADYRRWLSDRNLRSYYLALLCVHVSTLTGRPHYEEIASLLTEIARWLKVRGVFDALQIRKDFKAFERRNKDFMWVMHLFAELYQAEDEDPSISFGTRPETVPHGRRE